MKVSKSGDSIQNYVFHFDQLKGVFDKLLILQIGESNHIYVRIIFNICR